MSRMIGFGVALLALIASSLTGCVSYQAVGDFEGYNEVFSGTVDANLMTGGGSLRLETKHSHEVCTGRALPPDTIPSLVTCAGQEGNGYAECSDGRSVRFRWIATDCTHGYGQGKSNDGVPFHFVFGYNATEARNELAKREQAAEKRPSMPVYEPKKVRKEKGFATGTGFFITSDGVLVTNYHVIADADNVSVFLPGSKKLYRARVLEEDPANDVAVLKIDHTTKAVPLAPSFDVPKGGEVFTLGYPLIMIEGQEQKATFGHVNAYSGLRGDVRYVQIDVPIQPGNSGGPLIDSNGEVVGIVSATLNQMAALRESGSLPQNVNFAVKIDYVLPLLHKAPIAKMLAKHGYKDKTVPQLISIYEPSVALVISR